MDRVDSESLRFERSFFPDVFDGGEFLTEFQPLPDSVGVDDRAIGSLSTHGVPIRSVVISSPIVAVIAETFVCGLLDGTGR